MTGDLRTQETYWDRHFQKFDKIYSHRKSRLGILLDKIFRKDMYERLQFVLDNSEPIKGRTILDAGCGSGRFSLEFAKRGAKKVTGIDVSMNMIKLSQRLAEQTGLNSICDFRKCSIVEFQHYTKYDVAIAIGVFDYIKDPLPELTKLGRLSKGMVILSFPRIFTWRAPIRKLRLYLQKCDVYFYSRSKIKWLMNRADLNINKIEKVGKLYCVVAFPRS